MFQGWVLEIPDFSLHFLLPGCYLLFSASFPPPPPPSFNDPQEAIEKQMIAVLHYSTHTHTHNTELIQLF